MLTTVYLFLVISGGASSFYQTLSQLAPGCGGSENFENS